MNAVITNGHYQRPATGETNLYMRDSPLVFLDREFVAAPGGSAVDNDRLDELLRTAETRQFWLKPVGIKGRPMIINGREHEDFGEAEVQIRFTKKADEIGDGDILLVYRVGLAFLMHVVERLPQSEWRTPENDYPAGVRQRYPG